jgi:hypothetical protein
MDLSEVIKNYKEEEHGSFKEYISYINNELNKNILTDLHLSRKEMIDMLKKLENYKYVEEVDDLKYGAFIRWIPLVDPDDLPLHHAAMICEIKFTDEGTIISCKNFMHRHYTIKMDECLIFQKFTNEEKLMMEMVGEIGVPSR